MSALRRLNALGVKGAVSFSAKRLGRPVGSFNEDLFMVFLR
jgi:hypothetical protein